MIPGNQDLPSPAPSFPLSPPHFTTPSPTPLQPRQTRSNLHILVVEQPPTECAASANRANTVTKAHRSHQTPLGVKHFVDKLPPAQKYYNSLASNQQFKGCVNLINSLHKKLTEVGGFLNSVFHHEFSQIVLRMPENSHINGKFSKQNKDPFTVCDVAFKTYRKYMLNYILLENRTIDTQREDFKFEMCGYIRNRITKQSNTEMALSMIYQRGATLIQNYARPLQQLDQFSNLVRNSVKQFQQRKQEVTKTEQTSLILKGFVDTNCQYQLFNDDKAFGFLRDSDSLLYSQSPLPSVFLPKLICFGTNSCWSNVNSYSGLSSVVINYNKSTLEWFVLHKDSLDKLKAVLMKDYGQQLTADYFPTDISFLLANDLRFMMFVQNYRDLIHINRQYVYWARSPSGTAVTVRWYILPKAVSQFVVAESNTNKCLPLKALLTRLINHQAPLNTRFTQNATELIQIWMKKECETFNQMRMPDLPQKRQNLLQTSRFCSVCEHQIYQLHTVNEKGDCCLKCSKNSTDRVYSYDNIFDLENMLTSVKKYLKNPQTGYSENYLLCGGMSYAGLKCHCTYDRFRKKLASATKKDKCKKQCSGKKSYKQERSRSRERKRVEKSRYRQIDDDDEYAPTQFKDTQGRVIFRKRTKIPVERLNQGYARQSQIEMEIEKDTPEAIFLPEGSKESGSRNNFIRENISSRDFGGQRLFIDEEGPSIKYPVGNELIDFSDATRPTLNLTRTHNRDELDVGRFLTLSQK